MLAFLFLYEQRSLDGKHECPHSKRGNVALAPENNCSIISRRVTENKAKYFI